MRLKITAVSLTAAVAMLTTPALAVQPSTDHGKATTAPGQMCKSNSHKKTNHGKGKSPFAACVVGVHRAQADLAKNKPPLTAPGQLCKDQSHKRSAADKTSHRKSPFAACVTAAAKAQHDAPQGS